MHGDTVQLGRSMAILQANLRLTVAMLILLLETPASGAEMVLVNASAIPLQHFYVTPCGTPGWGHDQLAGIPVMPSRHFTVSNIPAGCYDLKVVVPPWNQCVAAGEMLRGTKAWIITWSTVFLSAGSDCSFASHNVSSGRHAWQPPVNP